MYFKQLMRPVCTGACVHLRVYVGTGMSDVVAGGRKRKKYVVVEWRLLIILTSSHQQYVVLFLED